MSNILKYSPKPDLELLLVEVDNDATDFMVMSNPGDVDGIFASVPQTYNLYANGIYNTTYRGLYLKEKPIILFTTKDATEGQAATLCGDKFNDKYYRFAKPGTLRPASMNHVYSCQTAKESLQSMITAAGGDTSRNYLLLKIEKK